jgi:hypothetical protein
MRRTSIAALGTVLGLSLSACGSSGTSNLPASALPQATAFTDEAQWDHTHAPQPTPWPGSNDLLYISNRGNNSITVYRHNAFGNTLPVQIIAGSNTGLVNPGTLSEDSQGNLYVANGYGLQSPKDVDPYAAILVFAHGANGNVAPIRILAGPLTGLHHVEAMMVDKATGQTFVFDETQLSDAGESNLLRFPPNLGNEAPYARSAIGLFPAVELASDSTGQHIIEAHVAPCCNSFNNGIETLAKQFSNGATPSAFYDVAAFSVMGVADDPTTKTYLTTSRNGIYRLAENTTGHFPYMGSPATIRPAPVSVITSDTCGGQLDRSTRAGAVYVRRA